MTLFTSIFDSLSKMPYEPELFGKALPCLTAIACALPPDYSATNNSEVDIFSKRNRTTEMGQYCPAPINTDS